MKKLFATLLGLSCAWILSTNINGADDEAKEDKKAKRPKLTEEQKGLRKEVRDKYDANKDGKLDPEERKKISDEDKAKLRKAAGEGKKKKKDR